MATKKPETVGVQYVGDSGTSVTVPVDSPERGAEDLVFPHGETVQVPAAVADRFRDSPNFKVL